MGDRIRFLGQTEGPDVSRGEPSDYIHVITAEGGQSTGIHPTKNGFFAILTDSHNIITKRVLVTVAETLSHEEQEYYANPDYASITLWQHEPLIVTGELQSSNTPNITGTFEVIPTVSEYTDHTFHSDNS